MSKKVIYGVFDDEEVLLDSARALRSKGVRIREVMPLVDLAEAC